MPPLISDPSTITADACGEPFCANDVLPLGVTVVVPMFNERECARQLVASLEEVELVLGQQYDLEFLFVDDGSTDDTVALLQAATLDKPRYRIVRHEVNRGIAAAIQTGLRARGMKSSRRWTATVPTIPYWSRN